MSCAVPGCTNNRRFKPEGVSFHRFPQDELLEEWLHALCKDPIKSWVWSKNKVVCSLHFRPEDFIFVAGRRIIKIDAVPSILPARKVRYAIEQPQLCRTDQNNAERNTSKNTSAKSSVVHFVIKPRPVLNVTSVPSVLESESRKSKYSVKEYVSKNATIKPSTSKDLASDSSVVHFVMKSQSALEESTPESLNRKLNKHGTQWESRKHLKTYSSRFTGHVKTNDSRHPGYNPIILSSNKPKSQGVTSACSTRGKSFSVSDLSKVSAAKPTVYVNTKKTNWKVCAIKKYGKANDPLALEASTSTAALVQPKPKRTANTVKIKVVKKILRRKLQTANVALATNSTRNDLKANVNMKRLTGLSLPFFTELLSFLEEDDHPRHKKLERTKRLLLLLIKMKWGISFTSLASLFQINPFSASSIFADTLDALYDISQQWLVVCAKSTKKSTGPCSRFKAIIDCFEVLIEYPDFLHFGEANFSSTNTKRHSYKFLLGVAPTGSVSFVSKAQGGNASKDTTVKSTCPSWLSCIQAGDLVAIGRGCPALKSVLEEKGAVPVPFSVQEGGLVELEELAACRRRFERTVQKLKGFEILKLITSEFSDQAMKKFEIFTLATPFSYQINKIVHMCCVLLNHKLLKPNRKNK